jgi:hypothetical protein
VLGVAGTLGEDLGAADLFHHMATVFVDIRVSAGKILRGTWIISLLELLFGLVALEGALAKAKFAEFHTRLRGSFGRVRGGIDDKTAAEGLTFAVIPPKDLPTIDVAMH